MFLSPAVRPSSQHGMSDASAPSSPVAKPPVRQDRRAQPVMKVTLYERVSSALMAAMLGVGAVLFAAVTYWLAHRPPPELKVVPLEIVQLEPEVDFGGSLDGVVGGTADVDTGMEGGGGGGESAASDVPTLESTIATVTSVAGTAAQQSTAAYLDAATASSNTPGTGTGAAERGPVEVGLHWDSVLARGAECRGNCGGLSVLPTTVPSMSMPASWMRSASSWESSCRMAA